MSNLSALRGAVLFAWLPEDENPHRPGPKFRPVFVMDVDPTARRLLVAYGTSQRVEANGLGEITFRQSEIEGLSKDTKFCLGKSKWIHLTKEYLSQSQSAEKLVVLGTIPNSRVREFRMRLNEITDL